MLMFDEVIKNTTVADVHAGGSLGNDKKKKKKADQEFKGDFKVTKVDEEQRLVFGWASISAIDGELVIDKQDDVIPIEELEKGAYEFVLYSRDQGDMHNRRGVGKLIESLVFTPEKEKLGVIAKNEDGKTIHGWFCGFYVTDDAMWKLYRAGKRPEFSIGGRAARCDA